MTTKFGFQCQFDSGNAERYNRELQPTHVMLINVVKREFLARLKADNPGVKLIYRHWPNYDWQNPTPEDAAQQAVAQLQAEIAPILDLLTYVTDDNEYILSKDHMALADIEAGDRYMAAFIKEARRVLGLGTCWGNFNTGHWGAETVDYFPNALAAANKDGDSPICFHEYNWPTIPDPGFWTCGKMLRAMPPIVAQYPDVHCMVTEFGVDDGGDPHKGWSLAFEDIDVAADMFCDGVAWYRDEVVAKATYLDAVLFFGCGMVSPWESFDVAPIIDDIKAVAGIVTPPEPPSNGGNMVKIYDFSNGPPDGATRDWAWLVSVFGEKVKIHPITEKYQPKIGEWVYIIDYLDARVGDSNCIINARDENGVPVQQETVIFWWKTAELHGFPDKGWNWTSNGVSGDTNQNGDVGPGMGTGAYYDPKTQEGPHKVWIYDLPSEMVSGIGMLAGGEPEPGVEGPHAHLNIGYKRMKWTGEEPPIPPSGDPVTELRQIADRIDAIADGLAASGMVTTVTVTYSGGQQVVFKPSLVAGVVRAVRSVFGR